MLPDSLPDSDAPFGSPSIDIHCPVPAEPVVKLLIPGPLAVAFASIAPFVELLAAAVRLLELPENFVFTDAVCPMPLTDSDRVRSNNGEIVADAFALGSRASEWFTNKIDIASTILVSVIFDIASLIEVLGQNCSEIGFRVDTTEKNSRICFLGTKLGGKSGMP